MQPITTILWLFSFLGYAWFLVKKCKLPLPVVPIIEMCGLTLGVYVFSLLGGMLAGRWILIAVGIVLGIWMIIAHSREMLRWGVLFFIVACTLLYCRYHDSLLLAYDDFSHWGMLVEHLLKYDALPDATAELIAFQSYPPASALWVYYVCSFLGGSEGIMLSAQAWLVLAGMLPIAALAGENNRASKLMGLVAPILVILSLFQGTASLMVDNLLASLAVGAFALALKSSDPQTHYEWTLAVLLTMLCLVKDSGLFFAAVVYVAFLFLMSHKKSVRKNWKRLIPPIAFPVLGRLTWWVHLKLVFPAAGLTRHAMSVENMRRMGSDKSYADLFSLCKSVFTRAASIENQVAQALVLMIIICVIVVTARYINTRRLNVGREIWLIGGALIAYIAYLFALWAMYAFTLSLQTAEQLVAFERYNSTFALFIYGATAGYALFSQKSESARTLALVLSLVLTLPLCIPSWHSGLNRLLKENYEIPLRNQMVVLRDKRPLKSGESAGFYLPNTEVDPTYALYMARYTYQSTGIKIYLDTELLSQELPAVLYMSKRNDNVLRAVADHPVEVITLN